MKPAIFIARAVAVWRAACDGFWQDFYADPDLLAWLRVTGWDD